MKLVYDNLVYSLQNYGGISAYWFELSRRLLNQHELDLTFYETGQEHYNIFRSQLNIGKNQVVVRKNINIFLERFLKLPACQIPNVFHSSYYRVPVKTAQTRTVCTVHDFTHDYYYGGPRVWLHNLAKRRAINECDLVISVSQNTKNDLLELHPHINESKIRVVYNGVSDEYKVLSEKVDLDRPFFLYIGLRDAYKNFAFAVKLAAGYPSFDLFIVGAPLSPAETQKVQKALGMRYKVFTGITNVRLNELYNHAFCLLYPSDYEGFGIPLLEAMRAGCPFVALKKSSIPEVAGEAGVLLNELEFEEAKKAVEEIDLNRATLVEKGIVQSQKFSWDRCFKETYDLYKTLTW
jgi:mannosyltransferase